MESYSSTKLLEEIKSSRGDEARRFFNKHLYRRLISFAQKLGLPEACQEDAAQKTTYVFIKTIQSGKYDRSKGRRLQDWIFDIAYRVMLNMRSKLSKERLIASNETGTSFFDLIEDKNVVRHTWNSEWQRMIAQLYLDKIRKMIKPEHFKVYEQYVLKNKSADEVAEEMGIPRGTVYVISHRVQEKIKILKDYF